jgi:long-chain acyl-CoA synthetase
MAMGEAVARSKFWSPEGAGGPLRLEWHYGDRELLCFRERWPDLNVMVGEVVRTHGECEAVVGDGRRLTYRALADLVTNAAGHLAGRGVRAGDRVALLLGNCPEFLIFLLACFRLGAIAVPMGTRQREPELRYLLSDCGAVALVLEAEFSSHLPPADAVPDLALRIAVGEGRPGCEPAAGFVEPIAPPPVPSMHEEDTAVILYTSGTTGRPKGAMLTHLSIIHSVITFRRCLGLEPGARAILAVPASHVTGLIAILLTMVSLGGATIMMRAFKAADFLALATAERLTYTLMVPAQYVLSLMQPEFSRIDLSRWRIGAFGGAPMPEAAIAALAERLPRLTLINAYGATETTSPSTIMPPGENAAHPDSVGQVVPCGEVRVVDAEGRPVPAGEPGELWIKGPMVVPGYWGKPEASAANFTGGYWRSGDIGSVDAEGFVRVHDRLKDMINRAGYKIYSAEVENALSHHPGVLECAVVGRPDPVLGERVQAFVRPRDPGVSAEEIRAFCAARMADYKVPEVIEFVADPLPRNANGKLQKAELRKRAAERSAE